MYLDWFFMINVKLLLRCSFRFPVHSQDNLSHKYRSSSVTDVPGARLASPISNI